MVSVAIANTGHFTFHGLGSTPDEATDALLAAWRLHARQTGADPGYLTRDDVNVITGAMGAAFRDLSPFGPYDPQEDRTDREVAYLAAVRSALAADDAAIKPYLTGRCPECTQHVTGPDGDHQMAGDFVIVGCEGYRIVNPNAVGIHSPNWQPVTLS